MPCLKSVNGGGRAAARGGGGAAEVSLGASAGHSWPRPSFPDPQPFPIYGRSLRPWLRGCSPSPGIGNGAEVSAGKRRRKAAPAAQPVAGAAVAVPLGRARNGALGADCEPVVPRQSRAWSPQPAAGEAAVAGGSRSPGGIAVLERQACALRWGGCLGSEIKF